MNTSKTAKLLCHRLFVFAVAAVTILLTIFGSVSSAYAASAHEVKPKALYDNYSAARKQFIYFEGDQSFKTVATYGTASSGATTTWRTIGAKLTYTGPDGKHIVYIRREDGTGYNSSLKYTEETSGNTVYCTTSLSYDTIIKKFNQKGTMTVNGKTVKIGDYIKAQVNAGKKIEIIMDKCVTVVNSGTQEGSFQAENTDGTVNTTGTYYTAKNDRLFDLFGEPGFDLDDDDKSIFGIKLRLYAPLTTSVISNTTLAQGDKTAHTLTGDTASGNVDRPTVSGGSGDYVYNWKIWSTRDGRFRNMVTEDIIANTDGISETNKGLIRQATGTKSATGWSTTGYITVPANCKTITFCCMDSSDDVASIHLYSGTDESTYLDWYGWDDVAGTAPRTVDMVDGTNYIRASFKTAKLSNCYIIAKCVANGENSYTFLYRGENVPYINSTTGKTVSGIPIASGQTNKALSTENNGLVDKSGWSTTSYIPVPDGCKYINYYLGGTDSNVAALHEYKEGGALNKFYPADRSVCTIELDADTKYIRIAFKTANLDKCYVTDITHKTFICSGKLINPGLVKGYSYGNLLLVANSDDAANIIANRTITCTVFSRKTSTYIPNIKDGEIVETNAGLINAGGKAYARLLTFGKSDIPEITMKTASGTAYDGTTWTNEDVVLSLKQTTPATGAGQLQLYQSGAWGDTSSPYTCSTEGVIGSSFRAYNKTWNDGKTYSISESSGSVNYSLAVSAHSGTYLSKGYTTATTKIDKTAPAATEGACTTSVSTSASAPTFSISKAFTLSDATSGLASFKIYSDSGKTKCIYTKEDFGLTNGTGPKESKINATLVSGITVTDGTSAAVYKDALNKTYYYAVTDVAGNTYDGSFTPSTDSNIAYKTTQVGISDTSGTTVSYATSTSYTYQWCYVKDDMECLPRVRSYIFGIPQDMG